MAEVYQHTYNTALSALLKIGDVTQYPGEEIKPEDFKKRLNQGGYNAGRRFNLDNGLPHDFKNFLETTRRILMREPDDPALQLMRQLYGIALLERATDTNFALKRIKFGPEEEQTYQELRSEANRRQLIRRNPFS